MWPRNSRYYPQHELEDGLAHLMVTLMIVVIFLSYLLSVMVTRLILHYLVNPLLDDRLSEDDQLLLLMSSLTWIVLGGIVILPVLMGQAPTDAPPGEVVGALIGGVVIVGAWGLLSGFGVLVWMYWEISSTSAWEPTHGFEAITNLPGEHYLPVEPEQPAEPEPTLEEIEAMLWGDLDSSDEMEFGEPLPQEEAPITSSPTPATGPVPSENGHQAEMMGR